jgi:S-layer homology domain
MSRKLRTGTIIATLLIAAPVVGLAYSAIQQAAFKDIPAGHWATEAVSYVTQQGLIQGYPDGTFKGPRTLTRYEAATIFYRLLKSGAMQNMTPAGQTTVNQGMDEVKAELAQVQTKLGALETSNGDNSTRLKALEDQVKTLGGTPAAPATNADTEARIKALEDQIKTLSAPAAAPATSADTDARIKALEDQVKTLGTPAAPAGNADLEARLKALEDKAATPAAPATGNADLEARVKALEDKPAPTVDTAAQDAKITDLDTRLKALEDTVNATPAVTPPAPVVTTTPPAPTTPVDVAPPPPPPAPRVPNFTIGLGVSTPIIPSFDISNNLQIAGYVGLRRLIGPIGARVNFDYNLRLSTLSLGPDLTIELAPTSFFDPYIGLGAGGIFGVENSLFVRGVAGINLNFSPAIGFWLEADPRYFILNASGFTFSARAGLKLSL